MPIVNSTDFPIVAATTSGSDLADRLNRLFDAYESNQFNPTRPLQLQKGGVWTRQEVSGDLSLMFYDGANDHVIGTVSISGGVGVSQFGSGKPLALAFDITHDYKKDEIIYDKPTQTYYSAKAAIAKGLPFNVGDWNLLDNVFNQIHQQLDIEGLCHVGTTPPPAPNKNGQMWYDVTDPDKPVFKIYHDGVWDNKGFGTPSEVEISYLLVGGGGAGGGSPGGDGGGGGGGGFLEGKFTAKAGKDVVILIGQGGVTPAVWNQAGANGGDTTLTYDGAPVGRAIGGGGGAGNAQAGNNGGSGGGGGWSGTTGYLGGNGTGSQGFAGGGGVVNVGAGGGGGAGGAGGMHVGGVGHQSIITGTAQFFAHGGVPAKAPPGAVGHGAGAANTGNGGGGAANGGSGIGIISMPTTSYVAANAVGAPQVIVSGAKTVLVFKSSGSYTF